MFNRYSSRILNAGDVRVRTPTEWGQNLFNYPKSWEGTDKYITKVTTGDPQAENGDYLARTSTYVHDHNMEVNPSIIFNLSAQNSCLIGKDGTFLTSTGKCISKDYYTYIAGEKVYGPWVELRTYDVGSVYLSLNEIEVLTIDDTFKNFLIVGLNQNVGEIDTNANWDIIYKTSNPDGSKILDLWTHYQQDGVDKYVISFNPKPDQKYNHLRLVVTERFPWSNKTNQELSFWDISGSITPTQYLNPFPELSQVDIPWPLLHSYSMYMNMPGDLIYQFGYQKVEDGLNGFVTFPVPMNTLFTIQAVPYNVEPPSGDHKGSGLTVINKVSNKYTSFIFDSRLGETNKYSFYWFAAGTSLTDS